MHLLRLHVRRLRVGDIEVEPVAADGEVGEHGVDQRMLVLVAPAADRDAVRAEDVDPHRVGVELVEAVRHVERDPREVVRLELDREPPRARQVARVVDEDPGAVERCRGCVRARGRRERAGAEAGDERERDPHQRPLKSGGRFSTNAFKPSVASSDARAR